MRIHYDGQSQFELFPGAPEEGKQRSGPRFMLTNITLTLDNIVVLLVLITMGLVLAYSFGVERGKQLVAKEYLAAAPTPITAYMPARPAAAVTPAPAAAKSAVAVATRVTPAAVPAVPAQASRVQAGNVSVKPAVAAAPVAAGSAVQSPSQKTVDKGYTIQVASFKDRTYAEQEATLLRKQGLEVLIIPKGNHLVVCVGRFTDNAKANAVLPKLRKQYKDSLVRRF